MKYKIVAGSMVAGSDMVGTLRERACMPDTQTHVRDEIGCRLGRRYQQLASLCVGVLLSVADVWLDATANNGDSSEMSTCQESCKCMRKD